MIYPVLLITSHGGVITEADKQFESPIPFSRIKATKCGVLNFMNQKIPQSIPRIIPEISEQSDDNEDFLINMQSRLKELEGTYPGNRYKETWMDNDEEVNEDKYSVEYTRFAKRPLSSQTQNNAIYKITKYPTGTLTTDKELQVLKSETSANRFNKMDNRVVLFSSSGEMIKDYLPNWNRHVKKTTPAHTAKLRTAKDRSKKLSDVLREIKSDYPDLEYLNVIDLSCNFIDEEDERRYRKLRRTFTDKGAKKYKTKRKKKNKRKKLKFKSKSKPKYKSK